MTSVQDQARRCSHPDLAPERIAFSLRPQVDLARYSTASSTRPWTAGELQRRACRARIVLQSVGRNVAVRHEASNQTEGCMDRPLGGLKFVDAKDLDDSGTAFAGVPVTDANGEQLGEVEGFIMDVRNGIPRHV